MRPLRQTAGALVLAAVVFSTAPAAAGDATAAGFAWPLSGPPEVGRRFTPPASAWGAGHRGVDLLSQPGTPVRAAADGRITYAGLLAGRGVVTVTHAGGLRTTYEPVDALVSVGEVVTTGEVVGLLDRGHASCPLGRACLHWGLLRGETYLDPLALVDRGRARLLPTTAHDRAGAAAWSETEAPRTTTMAGRTDTAPTDTGPTDTALAGTPRPTATAGTPTGSGGSSGSGGRRALAAGVVLAGAGVLAASRLRP